MAREQLLKSTTAWIEVETDALIHNLGAIREKLLEPKTRILAVLKANAYGHGALETARVLEQADVFAFGVTSLNEAVLLRQGGISLPLVLLSPFFASQAAEIVEHGLIAAVSSIRQLEALQQEAQRQEKSIKIHIKLETGMGRAGLWQGELEQFIERLLKAGNVEAEGIYSHLAQAADKQVSQRQFSRFLNVVAVFENAGIDIPIKHIANSTGLLNYPEMQLDLVRVGTLIFGQVPPGASESLELKNPWAAKARVSNLKKLPANWPIGYGGDFVTKKESLIGIIPVGFADGFSVSPNPYPKSLLDLLKILVKEVLAYFGKGSQALKVSYQGESYPVVGRVGMQLSMVDFSGAAIEENQEVSFPLKRIMASASLPRIYLKQGKPYKIVLPDQFIETK